MTEHYFNPAKPDEIVKELFNDNSEIINAFTDKFSKEILDFAESFSEAYKKYLELNRLSIGTENKQKAYVVGLTHLLFDNLLTSVKLFVMGFQIPSGNLMRQVIESVALTTLCSLRDNIRISIKKNKTKNIHFLTSFIENRAEAKSFKALQYLELNYQLLGINEDAIIALKKARRFFHNYSHPGIISLATTISFGTSDKVFMGGGFDKEKIHLYKKELIQRNNFCKILPNIIEGLIFRVKKLP
jgi:hypothetical protein